MLEQSILRMPEVVFAGKNSLDRMETIIEDNYKKVAVFTDKGVRNTGITDYPLEIIKSCKAETVIFDELPSEPTCDEAQKVIDDFKRSGADYIIAIGGGSVMDIAKLASIANTDAYHVRDLLQRPSLGRKQVKTLMIPTTAGTGSEATPNSIVAVPEKNLKIGIVNPQMMADAVILDGSMIRNLPKKIAASTGIDALSHAIECYTSNKANTFSNLYALEALKLIFGNIVRGCEDKDAESEKNNMLIAAFYAGIAITSSGTTAVHALSYPLGGRYHIPHGISNALMLLPVLEFNKPACSEEYARIYDAVTGMGTEDIRIEEKADRLLNQIQKILSRLELPSSLKAFGIGDSDLDALVHDGMEATRLLSNNKRLITPEDARKLYQGVMQ